MAGSCHAMTLARGQRCSNGRNAGHIVSSIMGWALAVGCRPSAWIMPGSSAILDRKNGSKASRCWRARSRNTFSKPSEYRAPVIRRDLHAEQQHLGAGVLGEDDHPLEVGARGLEGQPPQPVVAAELEDDDGGTVYGERSGQPREAPGRGLAADAGVGHAVPVTLCLQAVLEEGDPALFGRQPVPCADAVAHHQNSGGGRGSG